MNNENKQKPKSAFFKGAAVGSLLVVLLYSVFYGLTGNTGLGVFWEILIAVSVGALGVGLLWLVHALLVIIGRKLPRMFNGEIFAALGSLFKSVPIPTAGIVWASAFYLFLIKVTWYYYPPPFAFMVGPMMVIIEALIGGCIAYALAGEFKKTGLWKKIVTAAMVLLLLSFNVFLISWLTSDGNDDHLIKYKTHVPEHLQKLELPDPSRPGPHKVAALIYGSGSDIKRPEFGETVDIKTQPVDATVIYKGYKGWKAKARNWYWGFDFKKLPINGRTWYPADGNGTGPFPLVLMVHGNHNMHDYSDPGYAYLGELLASHGFIAVSVDENFMNGGFVGGIPGKKSENATRGWLLLQHIKAWTDFNKTEANPFYQKVDLDNISLIGHSRGGEAVTHAASQNRLPRFADDGNLQLGYNFGIKTVIAIAPVDGQYRPSQKPLPLENINYFSIQGSHDADMSVFHGNRQYQRVRFTDGNYWCKSTLYIYRANHGQFNTTWGRSDFTPPMSWFLNFKPLMPMEDQLKIAKVYLSAFLQATIQGKKEYLDIFKNHRTALHWLPETLYVNRFQDSNFTKITDFEEDINPVTASVEGVSLMGENLAVWSEDRLSFRGGGNQENHVARLGWKNDEEEKEKKKARFLVRLSQEFVSKQNMTPQTRLVFSITDTGKKPPKPEVDEEKDKNKRNNEEEEEKEPAKKKDEDKGEEDEKKKEKDPLDLTIELTDASGNSARLPLSWFSTLHPPLKVVFTKWPLLESIAYQDQVDPLLETFQFPMSAFIEVNPAFDPAKLETVAFLFDKGKEGVIYLDDIGFY